MNIRIVNGAANRDVFLDISRSDGSHPVSEEWLDMLIRHGNVFFLAEEDGKAVGFASLNMRFKYDKYGAELDIISVRQESQGKGVGTALLKAVEDYVKDAGKWSLYLFTSFDNYKARRFYAKHGYLVVGILADRYGEGRHSVIMRKDFD